jgi:dihydropyrimidinase
LIRGGTVVTATDVMQADVLMDGGVIVALGNALDAKPHTTVDATGCYVFPGGIDPHTHLDMPFGGTVTADDFATGTVAAALGGTTSIVDFALHTKGDSLANALATWKKKAAGKAAIDYAFHLTIADGRDETINEIQTMIEREGVNSFKVFMAYKHILQVDDETIFKVLGAAKRFGGLVQVHAENGDVIEVTTKEALAEGHTEPKWHALTRPVELEGEATHRAIRLAEVAGAPLYVVHVSSAMAADAISDGRKRGLAIYGETCPQYLVCSEDDYDRPDFAGANYVMSPPLRPKWNQNVLLRSLLVQQLRPKRIGQERFLEDPQRRADDRGPLRDPVALRLQRGGDRHQPLRFVGVHERGETLRALPAQRHDRDRLGRRCRDLGSVGRAHDFSGEPPHER